MNGSLSYVFSRRTGLEDGGRVPILFELEPADISISHVRGRALLVCRIHTLVRADVVFRAGIYLLRAFPAAPCLVDRRLFDMGVCSDSGLMGTCVLPRATSSPVS